MTHARHSDDPPMKDANVQHVGKSHYRSLSLMTVLSFVAMYGLMYAMVNAFDNVYNNWNQVYMAGLMAAAMVIIEVGVMREMYHDRRRNIIVMAAGIVVLAGCWLLIRQQAAIGDRQFLRSMIPHHAGAILMCEQASIRSAEIQQLCGGIVSSQQREIDQMKALLRAAR